MNATTSPTLNVIINGSTGRMGIEAIKAVNNDPTLNLVATLNSKDDLAHTISNHPGCIVVDLTSAKCVYENTKTIITNQAYPVIGTSGLLEEQITELKNLAQEFNVSGLIVPNFSLGAVLMMQFAKTASKYYQQVEIIERHHPNKLDAPSGTAIRTAELISENLKTDHIHNSKSEELIPGALGASYNNIPIHSIRLSGSCAHQTVLFGGFNETLNITHDSMHRESFMPGVLLACKQVKNLNGLQVGLETVMELDA